ncbi:hypothetical protein FRC02_003273 [Tulasnella sp. 418]|nr:hypothetical protein FRC02_003273 [Tulasnella sp. 418]
MATVTSIVQTVVVVTAGPSSSPTPTQTQTPHSTTRASRPRTSTSAASTPSTVKGNDIPIHDKDTPVLSTPLIIVISIIACIVTLSALGFIWCWARRKPRRPVPIVEHAGVSYWNAPFQHDHSQRFDDDKELQTDDTSSLSPPTRALESRSGASTPTQGLLRALDSPASFLKPLPTTSEHASTVSLHSAASSGDRTISNLPPPPQDSRYSDFPNPAGTDSPIRPRGGFGHTHSTSRHSMTSAGHYGSVQSSHHGHHSVQSSSHHGHYVRSASRQSYFVDPTVHSGPTPVRHTSIRAAPHKAGIQIVLPQPLAPAVQSYATSTSSLVSNGNDQPIPIDRSPRRHSSQALMMHAAHGGRESPYANGMPSSYRPRERSRRQTSEVSPLGQC